MREIAMWFQYELVRDRSARLQAEGLAAQRVAQLTGRRAKPHPIAGLILGARRWRGRGSGRRSLRGTASGSGQVAGAVRGQVAPEVACHRAAGTVVGRAA